MHRFFVPPECIKGDNITLPQRLAHQLGHVLRLGHRVLRAETAGLVTAAAVLYHWGEIG